MSDDIICRPSYIIVTFIKLKADTATIVKYRWGYNRSASRYWALSHCLMLNFFPRICLAGKHSFLFGDIINTMVKLKLSNVDLLMNKSPISSLSTYPLPMHPKVPPKPPLLRGEQSEPWIGIPLSLERSERSSLPTYPLPVPPSQPTISRLPPSQPISIHLYICIKYLQCCFTPSISMVNIFWHESRSPLLIFFGFNLTTDGSFSQDF